MGDNDKEVYTGPPEKEVYTDPNAIHNEKITSAHDEKMTVPGNEKSAAHHPEDDLADVATRRQSIGGNIVHNPLARLTKEGAVEDARTFAESFGMAEHAALF